MKGLEKVDSSEFIALVQPILKHQKRYDMIQQCVFTIFDIFVQLPVCFGGRFCFLELFRLACQEDKAVFDVQPSRPEEIATLVAQLCCD